MSPFETLLHERPVIFFHLVTALCALVLGIFILSRRKGTPSHKALGWAWVVLMGSTAIASAFIRDHRLPNLAGFTPIHAFTVLVAITLPMGIAAIRRGDVNAHRRAMTKIYIGGCVLAGFFTLVPGRFLGNLLWKQWLGVIA